MEMVEESIFPEKVTVYASFGDRFGASFIDTLVLLLPNLIVIYGIRTIMAHFESGTHTSYSFMGSDVTYNREALLINSIIRWLYSAILESGTGQATIGKKLSSIRVATVDGERLSFLQATGRHFGKLLSMLILFVGYFMMNWTAKSQTLHDKLAGAVVVKSDV